MSILTKPCEGKLSEETQQLLSTSRSRAGWGVYPCETCGQPVGVEEIGGKWAPEKHWPTVVYKPRKAVDTRYQAKRYSEAEPMESKMGR
jgi:hypothetical protein